MSQMNIVKYSVEAADEEQFVLSLPAGAQLSHLQLRSNSEAMEDRFIDLYFSYDPSVSVESRRFVMVRSEGEFSFSGKLVKHLKSSDYVLVQSTAYPLQIMENTRHLLELCPA